MEEQKEENIDEEIKTNAILELVFLLRSVDINSQKAELNTTTISDNNGGRIFL